LYLIKNLAYTTTKKDTGHTKKGGDSSDENHSHY
jgi:hypothetical protein